MHRRPAPPGGAEKTKALHEGPIGGREPKKPKTGPKRETKKSGGKARGKNNHAWDFKGVPRLLG